MPYDFISDYEGKPTSLVAEFELIPKTIESALNKKQLQPMIETSVTVPPPRLI